jgi:hypothetical protein
MLQLLSTVCAMWGTMIYIHLIGHGCAQKRKIDSAVMKACEERGKAGIGWWTRRGLQSIRVLPNLLPNLREARIRWDEARDCIQYNIFLDCTPSIPKWLSYFSDFFCPKMIVSFICMVRNLRLKVKYFRQTFYIKKSFDFATSGGV